MWVQKSLSEPERDREYGALEIERNVCRVGGSGKVGFVSFRWRLAVGSSNERIDGSTGFGDS
jgi:hypothetical protein